MTRIFLLFKNPIFRTVIDCLLSSTPGLEIVGWADQPEQAIPLILEYRPDVIVIDNGDTTVRWRTTLHALVKRGLRRRVIGINLKDNSMTIYHGRTTTVKAVEDLLAVIGDPSLTPLETCMEEWAVLAHSRRQIYGFLADIFNCRPDQQFAKQLKCMQVGEFFSAGEQPDTLPEEMQEGIQLLERYVHSRRDDSLEALSTELAAERSRLLRGIRSIFGPFYKAVFIEPDRQFSPNAGNKVHAQAGVKLPEEEKDQPDFIGSELETMGFLTGKEAGAWSAGDLNAALEVLETERVFLQGHITCWVPRFCQVMFEEARLDFYHGIARITSGFVESETEKVTELLECAPFMQNRR